MKRVLKLLNTAVFISCLCVFSANADFYVGIGGGYSLGKAKTEQGFTPDLNFNKSLSINGVTGQVFGSWEEFVSDKVLWGIEFIADISEASVKEETNFDVGEKHVLFLNYKHSFDGALKLGYQVNRATSLYMKAGISFAKWEVKSKNDAGQIKTKRKYLLGFRPAIGARIDITKRVAASLEYSHGFFQEIKTNHEMAPGGAADGPTTHKVSPNIGTVMLRLSCKL